ncbi:MAG: RNA methyltransferase substrate-binding domain-containing protein [Bacteroidales bacterium]|nr:RNA methyltransferase substrate-binding domain-containing protein [Bacteroidales bacterium]
MKQTEYIFGIRPIEEALEQGREIEKIVFQKNLRGEASRNLCRQHAAWKSLYSKCRWPR